MTARSSLTAPEEPIKPACGDMGGPNLESFPREDFGACVDAHPHGPPRELVPKGVSVIHKKGPNAHNTR